MARRCNVRSRELNRGVRPSLGSVHVGARQGERGGGAAGSSSLRTPNHSTSGLSPVSCAQTFWAIRVLSVWCVRSPACVSRGGGAVQSGCDRRQSGHDHDCVMHGLQKQCSCSALLQPRSCPRSGAPFSSCTSKQTPHGLPGHGCGASPSGILRRGTVRGMIGSRHGSARG